MWWGLDKAGNLLTIMLLTLLYISDTLVKKKINQGKQEQQVEQKYFTWENKM